MTYYYLSIPQFTVAVGMDDHGIIRDAPPIVRKFKGQHFDKLARWMHGKSRQGVIVKPLRSHEPPRTSGEGTAVDGPMPLGEKDDASASDLS